ncbi:hypothetical protein KUTeg_010619 [Tegillarca granosa]|uniref:Uncharacterized protein n=1 Tax=Tegillarca granosa TaxID=220873 RepID=A0ABQ9F3C5_TEGGR|nr:hypothetical protein KUTeg_010619 [Tegillarca granosa]
MFPTTSKRLLINHIKHADTHNRIVEEQEMWKSYSKLKEKGIENNYSFLDDKREDMGAEFCNRSDRRAHMDDEPLPVAKARGKDCTFWMRQLQKVEEADPERSNCDLIVRQTLDVDVDVTIDIYYKASDRLITFPITKSKKKRKDKKKRHKKSNHDNSDKKKRKSAELKHQKTFKCYKSPKSSKLLDDSDSNNDDQGHQYKKHKRKHSKKRSHDKHHKHRRKKKSENSKRSPSRSRRRSRSPLCNYSSDDERHLKLSKRKRKKHRYRSTSSSRSRSPDRSVRRSRSPLSKYSDGDERHLKRKRDKFRHRSTSSSTTSTTSTTSSSSETEDKHYTKYKEEMKKIADYVSNGGLLVTKNRHRKVPKRTSQNSCDSNFYQKGEKYFTVSDSEGEMDSF